MTSMSEMAAGAAVQEDTSAAGTVRIPRPILLRQRQSTRRWGDRMLGILQGGADKTPNNLVGYGIVDAYAAVKRALAP